MYGTRDAARNWYEELRKTFTVDMKAKVGVASPTVFLVPGKKGETRVAIHGDDIVAAGDPEDLEDILRQLRKNIQAQTRDPWDRTRAQETGGGTQPENKG